MLVLRLLGRGRVEFLAHCTGATIPSLFVRPLAALSGEPYYAVDAVRRRGPHEIFGVFVLRPRVRAPARRLVARKAHRPSPATKSRPSALVQGVCPPTAKRRGFRALVNNLFRFFDALTRRT